VSLTQRLRSVLGLAERGPTPDMTVRGSDSVTTVSGGIRTLADQERSWELRGTQGSRTYRSMRVDDPHIRGLRKAQNLPLIQASAEIDPSDPDDPDAVAKADFVREVLIADYPFRSFVSDSMLAIDYGFACFEIVWYRDSRTGKVRCRLELRPSSSIAPSDIAVVNGTIDHVVQRPLDGGEKTIPGDKLVWFAHDKEGAAFQGVPILRSMYRSWKIKRELEQELPSAVRRLAGIPDITYHGTLPDDAKTQLKQIGERIGLSADGYALHPDTAVVQLLTGNASISDILEAIKAQDQALSAACQAQVFDLGTSNAGSRALGTTLADLFANGVQAEAKYREDVVNASGGVIHQLVAFNFQNDENRPTLRFGHVQAVDMKSFAQALLTVGQAFQYLPEDMQEWARSEMNAPEGTGPTQVVVTKPESPAPVATKQRGPGADEAGDSTADSGAKAAECDCGAALQLAEGRTLRRAPIGVECFVALAEVDARFTDAKTGIREATQSTRDRLAAELSKRAQAAQESGKLAQFAAGAPPMVEVLTREVRAVLSDFFEAGRQQVADELERQRKGQPVTAPSLDERRDIAAAEKPKRKAKKAELPDPEKAMDEQADSIARSMAGATQAGAIQAAARIGAGVPLDPSAFAESVTRESDGAALRMGAVVSDMMSLGRATEANEQASDIAYGQVSAILDANTCEVCEEADGFESENLDEVDALCPNPGCYGTPNCRCLPVYVLSGVQEAA
jgi:hypothetical protein